MFLLTPLFQITPSPTHHACVSFSHQEQDTHEAPNVLLTASSSTSGRGGSSVEIKSLDINKVMSSLALCYGHGALVKGWGSGGRCTTLVSSGIMNG